MEIKLTGKIVKLIKSFDIIGYDAKGDTIVDGQATISISPPSHQEVMKIKTGDDLLIKVSDIKIKATTDGCVIEGVGFRIHEPSIVAIFPSAESKYCECHRNWRPWICDYASKKDRRTYPRHK